MSNLGFNFNHIQERKMQINHTRDKNLTDFGIETLKDRYLMPNEQPQDLFARVAKHYSYDEEHAQRIYNYISKLWFMPATPILSNGGNSRGLPISCFLSEATDNMDGIINTYVENAWLACRGGGIGSYWGNIRSIGENVGGVGKSSGVVPFLKVQDSLTLAISQGSLRRGSAAVYMPIWHPEVEDFIEVRRPQGGDPNRKCLNLHHGIVVDDKFMVAVRDGTDYDLLSPKDSSVIATVSARDLWAKLLTARIETGEPYIMYLDNVNAAIPPHHRELGLTVKMSNLCSEITLPTGKDHLGKERTAVCCLSSLNLEKYDQWKNDDQFILDVMYFLDNVLQDFIDNAEDTHSKAKYAAERERSVGLGVMGLHSLYQSKGYSVDSAEAYQLNREIFEHIHDEVNVANQLIAHDRGACPDALEAGYTNTRFSNCMAIAPTASISIICGGTSPGIEPPLANYFLHKTLSGSFGVKNKHLEKILEAKGLNTEEVWSTIKTNGGSVQHLDSLSEDEKKIFRTAAEIDQLDLIIQAAERQPYIDQAQSLNLFLQPDISKRRLSFLHQRGWELGLKTFYYCRSKSLQRADKPSEKIERVAMDECKDGVCSITPPVVVQKDDYEVCEACQ